MPLYLCVDCGGTKTATVISDSSGTIVGRGSGGPSNITYLSVEAFISAITEAIVEALKSALPDHADYSLPVADGKESFFAAAWFGVSGADSPSAIAKVTPAISSLIGIPAGPNLAIANDTHLLAAPMRMFREVTHAIAVIAGTGSIAVSFKEVAGKIDELGRVGGWGWILGDEGGGYDVGRETLRHILREEDLASVTGKPSPPSKLRDRVLARFGVAHPMEIFGGVYHGDPNATSPDSSFAADDIRRLPREKRISCLPRLVFAAAFDEDDWLAKRILATCVGSLASQVAVLLGDGEKDTEGKFVDPAKAVISFGGSLVGNESYRQLILDDLAGRGYTFPHVYFVEDAAATGAIALAAANASQADN
ncbi:hypothetical protein FA15DRAFT_440099 [Coprinopsis marcescibilis]|uniref:N-acetyl-D-glucosamine kinase n=1 Tax=Coprinopsis marcescibilis TaxID=230819 RepID=A0A5C3KUN6_COPMA|nr:hypothetical protein FA15DRAFT_440099 [Coprinopsis marcescibilis]